MTVRRRAILLACVSLATSRAHASDHPSSPLTIDAAVVFALDRHPALLVQGSAEEVRRAQVSYARTGYLPHLALSAEVDRGTGNVLRGSLFSLPSIPAVSGPPTGRAFDGGAWGTVVGVGLSWDVFGLVRQMAVVDANLAEQEQEKWATAVARLVVAFTAADAFVEVLTRDEAVRAAAAATERARALATVVHTLVSQDLRPGADESRAEAELALASTQRIRAEEAAAIGRAELARALGAAGEHVTVLPGRLLGSPRLPSDGKDLGRNPLLAKADAAVDSAKARQRATEWMYLPRLDVVGALWSRSSGFQSGSVSPSRGDGLTPDTPNWAAGIVLSWPVLDLVGVRARSRVEAAHVDAAQARRNEVGQAVQTEIDDAREILDASKRIAANTPIALKAARSTEEQASARYRAGLATIVEIAEAQRLLAQAEIDDAVARLNVWRSMLLLARALGDLQPFFASLAEGGN